MKVVQDQFKAGPLSSETIFRHKHADAFFTRQASILVLEFMEITFMGICPSELFCSGSLQGQTDPLRFLKKF